MWVDLNINLDSANTHTARSCANPGTKLHVEQEASQQQRTLYKELLTYLASRAVEDRCLDVAAQPITYESFPTGDMLMTA